MKWVKLSDTEASPTHFSYFGRSRKRSISICFTEKKFRKRVTPYYLYCSSEQDIFSSSSFSCLSDVVLTLSPWTDFLVMTPSWWWFWGKDRHDTRTLPLPMDMKSLSFTVTCETQKGRGAGEKYFAWRSIFKKHLPDALLLPPFISFEFILWRRHPRNTLKYILCIT